MGRYVLKHKPKSWSNEPWFDDDDHVPITPSTHLTIFDSHEPRYIGLLDADGDPIFEFPNRIGFIWHDEDELEALENSPEDVIEEPAEA
jgi:hypothetical protein